MKKRYLAASLLVPFVVQALLTVIVESRQESIPPSVFATMLLWFGQYMLSAAVGFALLARAVKQPLVLSIFYFPVMLVALGLFAGVVTAMVRGLL